MGKNEGDSARKLVFISIGLSLGIGLVLGGVIVFLELRSEIEIASLRSKVNGLIHEINTLRHNLRHLNNTVVGLDSREKSKEDPNNDEEYADYAEDYDDPNSDSYEDEEDSYNDTPAPPINLNPSSLTLSDDSKNDTRPKRESTSNLNTLTKEFLPLSKTKSHGNYRDAKNSGKQSSSPSTFNLLSSARPHYKEQQSDEIERLDNSETIFITHAVSTNHDKIERTPTTKKKRHLRVYSSELQTTDSTHRDKRGGRQEDVEVFTRPEFPTRSGSHSETVAAHYGADESKCKNTRHRHCDHNDRRYHPQYHLKDWQDTNWMNKLGASANFEMRDGVLVVQNSGLYFIYAQVFYADAHDVCGFRVYQNNQPILQCTTTTVHDATKHLHKRNSCFTGSLIHLQQGDELALKETEENRYTFFERTKSFFGLFKIGNV